MLSLADGNPGAMTALLEIKELCTDEEYTKCFGFLHYHKIKGSNIYLIWNDLCSRDSSKFKQYLLESNFNDSQNRKSIRPMFEW